MAPSINNQFNNDKFYLDNTWCEIESRDSHGFSVKKEDGTIIYIRKNDCTWFSRLIESNNKKIALLEDNIKNYDLQREFYLQAKQENANKIGDMRREFGYTLSNANGDQKSKFELEKDSYYTNSMTAVGFHNGAMNALSSIRDFKSQNAGFMREVSLFNSLSNRSV